MSYSDGEALSFFLCAKWLGYMGFDNVNFTLDSKTTTDVFNGHRVDITEFGLVLFACRRLFNAKFTNSKVEFTWRQANGVVHHLVEVDTLLASLNLVVLNKLLVMK